MTNEAFQALLACGPVLLDGATGSNLMRAGMPRGICTEVWVTEHPESLLALQRDYIAAGSQIIYAPTFCANRRGLARCGRENDVALLNRQLVALSLEAADGHALVAGDLTTTGVPLSVARVRLSPTAISCRFSRVRCSVLPSRSSTSLISLWRAGAASSEAAMPTPAAASSLAAP